MSDQPEPIKPDPAKKPKRPADMNQRAKMIVDLATGQADEGDPEAAKPGQAGGAKGGPARAEKLTADERSEIAKKAAAARWSKGE
ncbi:MAG: histone H1 [Planctomycetota bacterium]